VSRIGLGARRRGTVSTIAAVAMVAGIGASSATPVASAHAAASFQLVSQTFEVPAQGTASFTVQLPPSLSAAWTAGELVDSRLVITAYQPARSRADVVAAVDDQLPRAIDSVDLTPEQVVSVAGAITVSVPIEATTRTADALQMSNPGLHPVVIELVTDGDVDADLITFVLRLPTADEKPVATLPFATVMATTEPVEVDITGAATLRQPAIDELDRLAAALEVSPTPVAAAVPAAALVALAEQSPDVATRLTAALQANQLLADVRWPLDPSVAADAGRQTLYTDWLRRGEDAVADLGGGLIPSRAVHLIDRPTSAAGAALLGDLGARVLVISPPVYDATPNTLGGFVDTTQTIGVGVDDAAAIDAIVLDRAMSAWLSNDRPATQHDAILAMAELIGLQVQIDRSGANPSRRLIVLGAITEDGRIGIPNQQRYEALLDAVTTTTALRAADLAGQVDSTTRFRVSGEPVQVDLVAELDDGRAAELSSRLSTSDELAVEVANVGSMLPADDPRIVAWRDALQVVATDALLVGAVTTAVNGLRDELAALRSQVVLPGGFKFNLSDRTAPIRLRLTNTSDQPLTVRVRLSSSKLQPVPDRLEVLPPGQVKEIDIEVEVRSNGQFPVALEVFTPSGDTLVAPPVFLTAKVTAISGLGQLVTGAALLLVISWWVRHVQMERRARRADSVDRHPVTAGTLADS
jgi:hypothetical protein